MANRTANKQHGQTARQQKSCTVQTKPHMPEKQLTLNTEIHSKLHKCKLSSNRPDTYTFWLDLFRLNLNYFKIQPSPNRFTDFIQERYRYSTWFQELKSIEICYQAYNSQITSPVCLNWSHGEETAEHILLFRLTVSKMPTILWWHHGRVPGQ